MRNIRFNTKDSLTISLLLSFSIITGAHSGAFASSLSNSVTFLYIVVLLILFSLHQAVRFKPLDLYFLYNSLHSSSFLRTFIKKDTSIKFYVKIISHKISMKKVSYYLTLTYKVMENNKILIINGQNKISNFIWHTNIP